MLKQKTPLSQSTRPLIAPAIAGVLVLGLAGCKTEASNVARPTPVRATTVAFETGAETRQYAGVIKARYENDVAFRVPGKIVERKVNVGDAVEAGDLIARLDVTDYQLALEAQEAELAAARSSRDQALAAEQRYVTLHQEGWAAKAALDLRASAADEAKSRLERAERALEAQRNQVKYTELRAEHAGVISNLSAEAGQVVAAGQAIARLSRLDEREAVVAIPEQKLGELQSTQIFVTLWPEQRRRYRATLREISPQADPVSRTFEARFSIPDADAEVALGKTATVILERSASEPTVRLPLSAVMNDARGPMVWVVGRDGERLERRTVTVSFYSQQTAVIASGLTPGDRVVTLGVHTLDEAMPVRVVEEHATALQ